MNLPKLCRPFFCLSFLLLVPLSNLQAQINRDAPMYSPVIDGVLSEQETASQLSIPMAWPYDLGSLLLEGSGFDEEEISANWYVSWDATNLNISAFVLDNTPDYPLDSGGDGNRPYNAQDVIQPTFNPNNDPTHEFNPDPGGGPAAIYDFVVNTSDEFGPDVYRHGATLDEDEHAMISIAGTELDDSYVIEASIPWSVAMDDVQSDYVPAIDDVHGLSFILLSTGGDGPTLFTDFGEGANTIPEPSTWNSITLVGATAAEGDYDASGQFDVADIDLLSGAIQAGTNEVRFDLNADAAVDAADIVAWVTTLAGSWIGDSNLDGEFNSTDFVNAFQGGEYEDDLVGNSTWATGDWTGDGEFNSSDFVAAFQGGGFEMGPRAAVSSVPEPATSLLLLLVLPCCGSLRKRAATS